jgi:hypothetical protein
MANLTENSQIKSFAQLRGHTRIWKNDELVFDEDNAIVGGTGTSAPTGLKAYLAQSLNATVDRAINDLMGTGDSDLTSSATMESKDGILVMAEAGDYGNGTNPVYSTNTTTLTATQTYGRKWRGVIGYAVIGHDSRSPEGDFNTPFANQTFQTITLASGDSLTIDWEIYIA